MTPEELKASIQAAVDAAIADAYARGFEEGGQTAIKGMVEAASRAITPTMKSVAAAVAGVQEAFSQVHTPTALPAVRLDDEPEQERQHGKRAPKGLTRRVLARVLAHGVSLRMEDIQKRAIELDTRISPKTVYNDLRRESELYDRDALGRWKLKEPNPESQQEVEQMEASM